MDKQKLLQQIQQIKESIKSVMKGDVGNGETTTNATTNQEQP